MANENDDTLLDDVTAMAERIGLTGQERTRYIHEHMTRSGYRAVPTYVRGEDGEDETEDDSGGGFFGNSSRRPSRDQRDQRGGRRPQQRRRGGDDWYGS